MKYDCSKTDEFIHENARLCEYYLENDDPDERCDRCPLFTFDCGEPKAMDEVYISIVQKWSNEHPDNEETNGERLMKILEDTFNADFENENKKDITSFLLEFGHKTYRFTGSWLNAPYKKVKEEYNYEIKL